MKEIIPLLTELNGSTNKSDKIFYLVCLKKIGQLGKRLYKIKQDEQLKQELIFLYDYITKYQI